MSVSILSGEPIICVSWLDWDWLPLVPHHMMTRLAKHNRVLYVDYAIALSTFVVYPGKVKRWMDAGRAAGFGKFLRVLSAAAAGNARTPARQ
jgi:hypothetical protein